MRLFLFILFALLFVSVTGLQCHVGYSILRGSTIGEETKTCSKDSDYCYNATASVFALTTLQKAGCNSFICQFIKDDCFQTSLLGLPVTFCCCKNENLCNRGAVTGLRSTASLDASIINNLSTPE